MWTKENIPDQTGKTAIVTGSNAGVGYETALALYDAGAHVVLACRNPDNASNAINELQKHNGKGTLEAYQLDLSSLHSVKEFATTFLKNHDQLHLLINNAGVMIPPASKTEEGYELQFGVNFLGHFALTGYLYPLLKATTGARIVTVSSMAYVSGVIDFTNLKSENSYDAMREYRQSKLADLLFSLELHRRILKYGNPILSIAAQPGANKTELTRHMDNDELNTAIERVGGLMDPWQGALPSLYAAVSADAVGGALYGPDKDGGYRGYPAQATIAPHALDEELAARLWQMAETATGISFPG